MTLRRFETDLLQLLGFGLNLHIEADTGEEIVADMMYDYYLEHGPVKSRGGSDSRVPQISGECLLALANKQYQTIARSTQYLAELKQLMRFVIGFHLGDKKLKSRELFRLAGQ
jgi:DNA repair protein RecO (recombination protein O)